MHEDSEGKANLLFLLTGDPVASVHARPFPRVLLVSIFPTDPARRV